jgi:hypothetical protein
MGVRDVDSARTYGLTVKRRAPGLKPPQQLERVIWIGPRDMAYRLRRHQPLPDVGEAALEPRAARINPRELFPVRLLARGARGARGKAEERSRRSLNSRPEARVK